MRVSKYLIENNIGIRTLNNLCEYLRLDSVEVNSKISQEKKELLDLTLQSEQFENWMKVKLSLAKIQYTEAQKIIKPLFHNSDDNIDVLRGERILNSLTFLINNGSYREQDKELVKIISSNMSITEKISLLKLAKPFSKQKELSNKKITITHKNETISKEDINHNDQEDDVYESNPIDPYENFRWGGLEGEEAWDGYWNTH